MLQKEKDSLRQIYHKILSIYVCGCWQIQSDLRKVCYLKNGVCEEITPLDPTMTETFGLEIDRQTESDWRLAVCLANQV